MRFWSGSRSSATRNPALLENPSGNIMVFEVPEIILSEELYIPLPLQYFAQNRNDFCRVVSASDSDNELNTPDVSQSMTRCFLFFQAPAVDKKSPSGLAVITILSDTLCAWMFPVRALTNAAPSLKSMLWSSRPEISSATAPSSMQIYFIFPPQSLTARGALLHKSREGFIS